jgi:hypothetical protein
MRSSSDSAGAHGTGFAILGADFDVGSSWSALVFRAALPSNWNKPARARRRRKSRFPRWAASIGYRLVKALVKCIVILSEAKL